MEGIPVSRSHWKNNRIDKLFSLWMFKWFCWDMILENCRKFNMGGIDSIWPKCLVLKKDFIGGTHEFSLNVSSSVKWYLQNLCFFRKPILNHMRIFIRWYLILNAYLVDSFYNSGNVKSFPGRDTHSANSSV